MKKYLISKDKYIFILLFIFLLFSQSYATTYNAPNLNAIISIDITDWDANENMGIPWGGSETTDWYMWITWDNDYLYLGWDGPPMFPSNNDALVTYIDAQIGGSTTGIELETIGLTADFAIKIRQNVGNSGYYVYNSGWGTLINFDSNDFSSEGNNSNVFELRVAWTTLGNTGPSNFNIMSYVLKNNTDITAVWPSLDGSLNYSWNESGGEGVSPDSAPVLENPPDGGLPVTLSSFTSSYLDGNAILQWTTASESNNLGWNVYRSISQNIGQSIQVNYGLIPGAGTTTEPTEYFYLDESIHDYIEVNNIPQNSTFWYWLESVDNSNYTQNYGPVSLLISDEPNIDPPPITELFGLFQNYPNPFNPSTGISFNIEEDNYGELSIYNIKGAKIKTLFKGAISGNKEQPYTFTWDGTDEYGLNVSSGIYIYKLDTVKKTYSRKMVLTK